MEEGQERSYTSAELRELKDLILNLSGVSCSLWRISAQLPVTQNSVADRFCLQWCCSSSFVNVNDHTIGSCS